MARRTVTRPTRYASASSCSVGIWLPGWYAPDSILSRMPFITCS